MKETNSMKTVLAVLGEGHMLSMLLDNFEATLSLLSMDKKIEKIVTPEKLFDIQSDLECCKSDVHNIIRKVYKIASETASLDDVEEATLKKKKTLYDHLGGEKGLGMIKKVDPNELPKNPSLDNIIGYLTQKMREGSEEEEGEE